MKLDLHFIEVYPHSIEKVWAAVSEAKGLAAWLMESDFEPQVGHRFKFRNEPLKPDWRGAIDCEVIAIEPPSRIVWSWRHSDDGFATQVEIKLNAVEGGTRLILHHIGETTPDRSRGYATGWPLKFATLREHLAKG